MRQPHLGRTLSGSRTALSGGPLYWEGPPMLQPRSSSELLAPTHGAGAQVNRRPLVHDWQDHALRPLSAVELVDVQRLAQLPNHGRMIVGRTDAKKLAPVEFGSQGAGSGPACECAPWTGSGGPARPKNPCRPRSP